MLRYDSKIRVAIEPKPNEPVDRSVCGTMGHVMAVSAATIDPSRVGGNLESAHAVLAGLDPTNEIGFALAFDKLYTVHQWIHYENEYAYAGAKWNEICNLTYTDAIFNHKKGQCVQYNGAMALFLAYYGFDVYMVRGWTNPGVQHYWTEVNLGGKVYVVECGNSGKNGDWWQSFFKEIDGLGQAYYTGK